MDQAVLVLLAMFLWITGSNPTITLRCWVHLSIQPWWVFVVTRRCWSPASSNSGYRRRKKRVGSIFYFNSLLTLVVRPERDRGSSSGLLKDTPSRLRRMFPTLGMILLVSFFFWIHYFFSSITSHAAAMCPWCSPVGTSIPGLSIATLTAALRLLTGIDGVISPYATGPAPMYFGSGLSARPISGSSAMIFGLIYLPALLIVLPWLQVIG